MTEAAGARVHDSPYAWMRLIVSVLASTIGGVGMWSVVVALPPIQDEFGITRAEAALPYTMAMLGFAFGAVAMGRLADRFGAAVPVALSGLFLGVGYVAAGVAPNLWGVALAYGLPIGLIGSAGVFGPIVADASQWFVRRRGLAVGIAASGNYLAGAFWPPVVQHFTEQFGWRATHIGIGVACVVTLLPLALLLRPRPPAAGASGSAIRVRNLQMPPRVVQGLLCLAGFACCVAMAMPQVHIVAYCGDLGYGVARGAEMLALMLALGIISRIASGLVADRIGGLATLLIGSGLQGVALFFYLWFDGLTSLYVISGMFGLFQGGITPSYAVIVREYFPAQEAATRLGAILAFTLFGMAFGGWVSGWVFDMTGSYQAAFANGLLWNLVNFSIVLLLLSRRSRPRTQAAPAT